MSFLSLRRSGKYTVFIEQALRIKPEFQGQGLNHAILEFIFNYIKTEFPMDNSFMLSTSKPLWPTHLYGKQNDDNQDMLDHIDKDS